MPATLTVPVIGPNPTALNEAVDRLYRLTVHQYDEMTKMGILTEEDNVELLEGFILAKMTKHAPHIVATGLAQDVLASRLPQGWHVSIQDPITTIDSRPEPDVKIVRGRRRDYLTRNATAVDVPLVIEVADSSLPFDRRIKKRIYASADISIYWIVNLNDRCVEVYENPTGPCDAPDYRKTIVFKENETLPLILLGQEVGRIEVGELLP